MTDSEIMIEWMVKELRKECRTQQTKGESPKGPLENRREQPLGNILLYR